MPKRRAKSPHNRVPVQQRPRHTFASNGAVSDLSDDSADAFDSSSTGDSDTPMISAPGETDPVIHLASPPVPGLPKTRSGVSVSTSMLATLRTLSLPSTAADFDSISSFAASLPPLSYDPTPQATPHPSLTSPALLSNPDCDVDGISMEIDVATISKIGSMFSYEPAGYGFTAMERIDLGLYKCRIATMPTHLYIPSDKRTVFLQELNAVMMSLHVLNAKETLLAERSIRFDTVTLQRALRQSGVDTVLLQMYGFKQRVPAAFSFISSLLRSRKGRGGPLVVLDVARTFTTRHADGKLIDLLKFDIGGVTIGNTTQWVGYA